MGREFEGKKSEELKIELRDFLAMMMPQPPARYERGASDDIIFMAKMKARYAMADTIIREVR